VSFVGLAYQGKDIVFRFIIEYAAAAISRPPPLPSSSSSGMRNLDGWINDRTDG
jgi:hypothetical protein